MRGLLGGDPLIDRLGGARRKHSGGEQAGGSPLGIVLRIVLDGIPESIVIGLGLPTGTVSASPCFLSNLPGAVAATTGLSKAGWNRSHILWLWVLVTVIAGLSSTAGYALLQDASVNTVSFVLAFPGGAVLTMLADTMMPEAFEQSGRLVGVSHDGRFAIGFALSTLE